MFQIIFNTVLFSCHKTDIIVLSKLDYDFNRFFLFLKSTLQMIKKSFKALL